jgi:threonine synthase
LSIQYEWSTRCTSGDVRAQLKTSTGSLWRYEALLPVSSIHSSGLTVGWTPLFRAGTVGGVSLLLKDETRNPSGSLKDRASEVTLAYARGQGIREVILASTGNAAASTACIGSAMGLSVGVFVPRTIPDAKLAQIIAYGAAVYRVNGTYDDAYEVCQKVSDEYGVYNRNTGHNPYTREGKKTCAYEIAEQLQWQVPDWVIVPTGDGNILSAMWKGFVELNLLGVTSSTPRLIAAQAETSNSISLALEARRAKRVGMDTNADPATIADSIAVRSARDQTAAVSALMESNGTAVAVSDADIVSAVKTLASKWGIFVEPSAAASYAAFEKMQSAGTYDLDATVVCLLTGTGLKDLRPILNQITPTAIQSIEPDAWRNWSVRP